LQLNLPKEIEQKVVVAIYNFQENALKNPDDGSAAMMQDGSKRRQVP
jgi:hypothetical protein